MISDYANFVKQLKNMTIKAIQNVTDQNKKRDLEDDIQSILKMKAKSIHRNNENRTYRDLINGPFDVNVIHIQRSNTADDVSNKLFDYSTETIKQLRDDGYNDAISQFRCTPFENKSC